MDTIVSRLDIIQIFCEVDYFCQQFEQLALVTAATTNCLRCLEKSSLVIDVAVLENSTHQNI